MIDLQLQHTEPFSCRVYNNDILIKEHDQQEIHDLVIEKIPAHIKIEINPWRIQPIVRINNIMVNYGLAKITPWDHMLEFRISENFEEEYFHSIVQSKKEYLKINDDEVKKIMGLDNVHTNMIEKIKKNIV